MNPTYSAEAEAYREQIRSFLKEHLPSNWKGLSAIDPSMREGFVTQWRKVLGEYGFVAPAWPKEYGGGGLSPIERVILHEEFAKARAKLNSVRSGPLSLLRVQALNQLGIATQVIPFR